LALVLATTGAKASAASFDYVVNPSRYIFSAPISPTDPEECARLSQRFSEVIRDYSVTHDDCLSGAPRDDGSDGGTCSKSTCQYLHDLRDKASKWAAEKNQECQKRLGEYQQRKREEEAEARRREQARLEREARYAREEAERLQRVRTREAESDRAETERKREEAKRKAEQAEEAARKAKEALNLWDTGNKTRKLVTDPVGYLQGKAVAKVETTVRGETPAQSYADYQLMLDRVKEMNELSKRGNPFAAKLSDRAFDEVGRIHGSTLNQLDSAMGQVRNFEATAPSIPASNPFRPTPIKSMGGGADTASVELAPAPATNPFARGGKSQPVKETQQTGREEENGSGDSGMTASSGSATRVPPVENTPDRPRASPATAAPSANPFAVARTQRYLDPVSKVEYVIPPEHVLYRDPKSKKLIVVKRSELSQTPKDGDRADQGEKGCSQSGLGVVTPECEKKRGQKGKQPVGR
jgi:hypothetical protein